MDGQNKDQVITVGKYRVEVVKNNCIGCGTCTAMAPNTFVLDDQGKTVIKEGAADAPEIILTAAQSCPSEAIIITDTQTGARIWPK